MDILMQLRTVATRWSARVSLPRNFEGYVTKFAPHMALKLIARGKLIFDERVVVHRVEQRMRARIGLAGVFPRALRAESNRLFQLLICTGARRNPAT